MMDSGSSAGCDYDGGRIINIGLMPHNRRRMAIGGLGIMVRLGLGFLDSLPLFQEFSLLELREHLNKLTIDYIRSPSY